ncbi:hypothetical protein BGZ95_003492 [Linnemannia exigua]|uniref:Uncharacterized protein n=1 Tax=Linnemannia exigua TaxID=604196 RepID=A0AAD4HC61_9FUNG|nr:hypothetical protein BGZ95_003492 [Linnemannia exigua]
MTLLCCSCLPRKQRDNLSSRSLYPDQDSSGHDDYSDDDNYDHYPSRLETLGNNSNSNHSNYNPWPSSFSNGRFSRGGNAPHQRKPNPFRTAYHDSDGDDDSDDEAVANRNDGGGQRKGKGMGFTSFAPYRDDSDSGDSADALGEEQAGEEDRRLPKEPKTMGSSEPKDESSSSALQNPTRIHAKMDISPYKVFDTVSTAHPITTATTTRGGRPLRPPRNPQGKMRWHDGDSDDNEDGAADAEEIIDVDALIAEQERITRELAAQEEALRQEEEATVLTKRLAAIRAAEKRGLLRFEGDQIVIPNGEKAQDDGSGYERFPEYRQIRAPVIIFQNHHHDFEFNFDIYKHWSQYSQNNRLYRSINFNKVDGVIAGEGGSSDEASFSDQEHVLGKNRANHARGPQENRVQGSKEVNVLEPKLASVEEVPTVLRAVTPVPFDSANQEDEDEQPYPADPFNATHTSELLDDNDNSSIRRNSQASKERITPDSPAAAERKDADKTKIETTIPVSPVSPVLYSPLSEVVAAVPERVFSTFTSIFNTGSSFMGLWGAGASIGTGGAGGDGSDDRTNGGVAADGRRLSRLKYGDPKKHRFNYQDHNSPSSSGQSQVVVGKPTDDDDNSSIDDYDF